MGRIPKYINEPPGTYVNKTVRWSLALISVLIAGLNTWLWLDAPFRYRDLNPNERWIHGVTSAWISLSGIGAIGVYLILHHDQKLLAGYELVERKHRAYRQHIDEKMSNRQYAEIAQTIQYVDVEPEPEPQVHQLPDRQAEPLVIPEKPQPEPEPIPVSRNSEEVAVRNSEPKDQNRGSGRREPEPEPEPESEPKPPEQKYSPPPIDFEEEEEEVLESQDQEYSILTDPEYSQMVRAAKDLNSHVICAIPGTGKTTYLQGLIWIINLLYPDTNFRIVTLKNDRFLGLEKIGQVVLVEDNNEIVEEFRRADELLEKRRKLPSEEWSKLNRDMSIFVDFYSMLNRCTAEQVAEIKQSSGNVIPLGRGPKVQFVFDTQELNVADLGLKGKDVRSILNIHALGFISDRDDGDGVQGGYDALNSVLERDGVGNKNVKKELERELPRWLAKSEKQKRPVIFTTTGIKPTLGLVPNLSWLRDKELPMVSDRLAAKEKDKPRSEVAQSINLEKSEEADSLFDGLSTWASKLISELILKPGSCFDINELLANSPVKSCDITWDDSIQPEHRTDEFALFRAISECKANGLVSFDEKAGEVKLI